MDARDPQWNDGSFHAWSNDPRWVHPGNAGEVQPPTQEAHHPGYPERHYEPVGQYAVPSPYYPQNPGYPQVAPEFALPVEERILQDRVLQPDAFPSARQTYPPPSGSHVPTVNDPWSPYPRYDAVKQENAPYHPEYRYYQSSSSEIQPNIYAAASGSQRESLSAPYAPMDVSLPPSPMDVSPSAQPIPTPSGKTRFACPQPNCSSRSFTRAADLTRHIQTIHAEKRFKCEDPKCPRTFSRRDHLTEHLRSHHNVDIKKRPSGPNLIAAPVSSPTGMTLVTDETQAVPQPTNAIEPLSSDRSRAIYTHACSQCNKAFVRAGDLRKHEKVHVANKDREHRCDICGRAFLYPKDLERHKRTQHPSEDTPAFFCPVPGCTRAPGQKPFYRKDKLQEHARKIHGQKLDELEKMENG